MAEPATGLLTLATPQAFDAYVREDAAVRLAYLVSYLARLPTHEQRRSFFEAFSDPKRGRSPAFVIEVKRRVLAAMAAPPTPPPPVGMNAEPFSPLGSTDEGDAGQRVLPALPVAGTDGRDRWVGSGGATY